MAFNYYCHHCDKHINRRSKKKHINSKAHLYMYRNIVISKISIGDVYWDNFVETIDKCMSHHLNKFQSFTTMVKCKIANQDITIPIDKVRDYVPFYECWDDEDRRLYFKYLNKSSLKHHIWYSGFVSDGDYDNEFNSKTCINDIVIIFFSKYKSITGKHKLICQPRRILESKLLKHMHNMSYDDKINKYEFLSRAYGFI